MWLSRAILGYVRTIARSATPTVNKVYFPLLAHRDNFAATQQFNRFRKRRGHSAGRADSKSGFRVRAPKPLPSARVQRRMRFKRPLHRTAAKPALT